MAVNESTGLKADTTLGEVEQGPVHSEKGPISPSDSPTHEQRHHALHGLEVSNPIFAVMVLSKTVASDTLIWSALPALALSSLHHGSLSQSRSSLRLPMEVPPRCFMDRSLQASVVALSDFRLPNLLQCEHSVWLRELC